MSAGLRHKSGLSHNDAGKLLDPKVLGHHRVLSTDSVASTAVPYSDVALEELDLRSVASVSGLGHHRVNSTDSAASSSSWWVRGHHRGVSTDSAASSASSCASIAPTHVSGRLDWADLEDSDEEVDYRKVVHRKVEGSNDDSSQSTEAPLVLDECPAETEVPQCGQEACTEQSSQLTRVVHALDECRCSGILWVDTKAFHENTHLISEGLERVSNGLPVKRFKGAQNVIRWFAKHPKQSQYLAVVSRDHQDALRSFLRSFAPGQRAPVRCMVVYGQDTSSRVASPAQGSASRGGLSVRYTDSWEDALQDAADSQRLLWVDASSTVPAASDDCTLSAELDKLARRAAEPEDMLRFCSALEVVDYFGQAIAEAQQSSRSQRERAKKDRNRVRKGREWLAPKYLAVSAPEHAKALEAYWRNWWGDGRGSPVHEMVVYGETLADVGAPPPGDEALVVVEASSLAEVLTTVADVAASSVPDDDEVQHEHARHDEGVAVSRACGSQEVPEDSPTAVENLNCAPDRFGDSSSSPGSPSPPSPPCSASLSPPTPLVPPTANWPRTGSSCFGLQPPKGLSLPVGYNIGVPSRSTVNLLQPPSIRQSLVPGFLVQPPMPSIPPAAFGTQTMLMYGALPAIAEEAGHPGA